MEIRHPQSTHLMLEDCRRLTGPSLLSDRPGAILDALIRDFDIDAVVQVCYRQLTQLQQQIGWQDRLRRHRSFENGLSLFIEAPVDQLYSATRVLETAWYFSVCELLDIEISQREELLFAIRQAIQEESRPDLIALQQAAHDRGIDILIDDDEVSLGHGENSICWPIDRIPAIDDINWQIIANLPVAVITGTNGKSTTVRLLDAIARAAGQVSGITSTDFVRVGNDVLDEGDYSGPGGARLLLRDKRLQVAFLEVARGGMLRRGLPLRGAVVALVTNVDRDHLGQYGINTLEALIEVKFIVSSALVEGGVLVLNADDRGIVDYARSHKLADICWYSLDKDNSRINEALACGKNGCFIDAGHLLYFDGVRPRSVCAVDDIPMTLGGAARHNVSNALAATGVAAAMGYSLEQIRDGLKSFNSDDSDNPGRLNRFILQSGARVFVDFAHNAHSVAAVVDTIECIPADRKWVMFGSAGDRSDQEIRAMARKICSMKPDRIVIVEVGDYLRGRESGEVSALLKQACLDFGMQESRLSFADSPLSGVQLVASSLRADDLALCLVLSQRRAVIQLLEAM